jgi:hypothetical protein
MKNHETELFPTVATELSEDEKILLDQNGGKVLSPILVWEFESVEDFKMNSNNFFMFFMNLPEGPNKDAYKGRGAYKRFKYLFSELHESLENNLSVPISVETNHKIVQLAFEAYRLMACLVDEYDENAMIDGKANENTLVQ